MTSSEARVLGRDLGRQLLVYAPSQGSPFGGRDQAVSESVPLAAEPSEPIRCVECGRRPARSFSLFCGSCSRLIRQDRWGEI